MEQTENQEGELSLACKRRTKRKRTVSIKLGNLSLAYRAEAMQQQMTTNVKASCDEIITESSKADYVSISIPQSKNFATLSEKNAKKIKYVRKKLKQNKNEEEIEQKNKKKLKNIEVTQQQMTTNVKANGAKLIDDSNEEDYMNTPIFIQESENFATLSEKNVKEIKDVRKKLKQNKNGEKKEKKIKKKFRNIEVTQQQMTTNGKAAGAEMIDDSSVDNYMHNPIFIQEPENVATLSKKNVKEIKDVRKKLKQNKNEEEMKNKIKKILKNIEVTQQQMTTNVKAAGAEMINDSSEKDYINCSIFVQEPENFATLSEKNVKKIKDFRKKLKQNKNEEKIEKKNKKKLKNIEVTQQQMTTNVKANGAKLIDDSNEEDYMNTPIFIQESENFATLSEKNVKETKDVRKKLKQNKNGEKKEKKIKKKFRNIEVTQQQMTTNGKAAGAEMIDDSSVDNYMHNPIFIQEPENVATLSKKNVKEIKDVRKKLKQNKNEEEMKNKIKKILKNIEVTQQQMTTNVKAAGAEMINDSSEKDYINCSIFVQEPENFATLSEKNVKKIKDFRKKLKQNKNEEKIEKKNKKKLKNIEVTQQQMTTNVKASCDEIIIESSKADYISVSIPQSKNFATLSEKNAKKIKYVREKLKQNKYEEEMEQKNKKKLKNIEATQQQMTTNVKAAGAEMIDDSSKEDYIHRPIIIQESENFATLSEKNVKEIKDVRKKLKQNKNEEEMKKKNKKKLKNIEVTRQQMTTNVKAAGAEMIDDSSEEGYMHSSIFVQVPENFATLSEKNVKEIKDVRKKLKQNKNEEEMEKKSKKKFKNIEVTQQQMTTNGNAAGAEMIDDSSKKDYKHTSIFIQESENFATLSEKNVMEIKDVRKELEQNRNEEKEEKIDKNILKNIGTTQQQMTTTVKVSHNEIITESNKADDIRVLVYIPQSENFATLPEKNDKNIKYVPEKFEQSPEQVNKDSLIELLTDSAEKMNKMLNSETKAIKLLEDIKTDDESIIIKRQIRGEDKVTDAKTENDDVNNNCQTTVNNKNKEHGYTLNESVEEDQVIQVTDENEIKEVENTDPGTTSNEALLYGKDVILENIGKMTNGTLMVEDISNVAHKIDKKIDVRKNWWTIIITEPNKADDIRVLVYIPQSENFATLPEKNDKNIKYVPEKFEQSPEQVNKDSLIELLTDSAEKMNKMLNSETKAIKLLEDIKTDDESIIIKRQIRGEDKVTDAKTENDDVNNNCQTTVNNKNKEHGYTLNESVEEDQVIQVTDENEIKEVENTDPGTTSNETLLYGKDVILENNGKMTNGTLMVEDISNVAHKIDKQIDVRKNWWTMYIENVFTTIILLIIIIIIIIIILRL